MRKLKDFVEVTALYDGKRSLIRSESIIAVHDNADQDVDYGVKPEHRTIEYTGGSIDVIETLDDIIDMIYNAEL